MLANRFALLATACLLPVLALQAPALAQSAGPDAPLPVRQVPTRPTPTVPGQAPATSGPGSEAPARAAPAAPVRAAVPAGGTIATIRIEGNRRIEQNTILSYMSLQPGDPFDADRMDSSLKTLYATGLFSDVKLSRDGNALVVTLVENPVVDQVTFEGNNKINDDTIKGLVQIRPRSVYTPELAQADRQRILDAYALRGRYAASVEPKIIRESNNRVNVIFEIHEGSATLISRIAFVGNKNFGEGQLREVISSRQDAWWRFLSNADQYNPDRVRFDAELLRRFYLSKGYADVEITEQRAELTPDRDSFFLTFVINEGERYHIGKVTAESKLAKIPDAALVPLEEPETGDWYNGDAVDRTTEAMSQYAQAHGYPFVEVQPRAARNRDSKTVDLDFTVQDGPHVYVDRIDISGNTRTKDKVVRRELRLAEGDALNADAIKRSKERLTNLGYFETVDIDPVPGSAPDRQNLNVVLAEKATGDVTLGGGYSTDIGALVSVGLHEKNLVGTGIDTGINGVLAQKQSQVSFSMTDPYFLDRNLVAGFELFRIQDNNLDEARYNETRTGFSLRLGYEFNEHFRQSWTYSLVQRDVYDVQSGASIYIEDLAGTSLLSQLSQLFTTDYRDSTLDPHKGWVTRLGTDFAGLGGDARYVRAKIDGQYFIPLDNVFGEPDYTLAISAGTGYLFTLGAQEKIIDRFFLGGENLRGFLSGGVGPHDASTGDSLGGRFIWTQSTELRYPLPLPKDLGLSGRAFVDVGALTQSSRSGLINGTEVTVNDNPAPRIGIGVGVAWHSPFGIINIDLADAVLKYKGDQTQVFRFGFGTGF